jgi:hypothetical protein
MANPVSKPADLWPALPLQEWNETYHILHMWTQIVGKIRLAQTPLINHWWNVTLYVTARGLTTSPMPYDSSTFEIYFDFVEHRLLITKDNGDVSVIDLAGLSVAGFYDKLMGTLRSMDLEMKIWPVPMEVANPIRFEQDNAGRFDPEHALRFWHVLVQVNRVFTEFRSSFIGKASPVHFFWGGFDHAVTRFSGRPAPRHPGIPGVPDLITLEGYSHEVSSCGFWPGGGAIDHAAFYSYAYAEPSGYKDYPVNPSEAYYSKELGEFLLPYDAVRNADSPDRKLLQFLQSTYEAAATCGRWDRTALERKMPRAA